MTLGKLFGFWFSLLMITLVVVFVGVTPAQLRDTAMIEIETSRHLIPSKDVDKIIRRVNEWHAAFTGLAQSYQASQKAASGQTRNTRGAAELSQPMNNIIRGILDRASYLMYLVSFRLLWLAEAMVPMAVFAIAAAIDGLAIRRRRGYTFAATSTAIYNFSSYAVMTAAFLPLYYLIAPLALPAIALSAACMCIGAAVWVFFAHLPGAAPIIGMQT
ncbi:MAG: DUF4400 domain-containing protein [Rhodocyclaceae bacterium]|nr:DUF4400 domain-containing protein [Rhodocyclaceae bacterium]MCA3025600.1 DUF4400 domain-containing protein [Rhodocyclaceae bacterium]MCA3037315.1 DUF4400 domain-containing protein [Rhodocyclaceae bacterium]MCA3040456.1 DUF4400 domain-containing protein [Rhodocyclaceae bacterium]MCA3041918.1 DUF4400 domain-containing protein [Rhodocyclaceae bacterium]